MKINKTNKKIKIWVSITELSIYTSLQKKFLLINKINNFWFYFKNNFI
jgi:hypothetical protein